MRPLIALVLFAAPAAAQTCPPAADDAVARAALIAQMQQAKTAAAASLLMNDYWRLQTVAPDAKAQALLDQGMTERADADLEAARATLDRLVAYCPDFVEGYNQRAFVAFLAADFPAALADLDRVLAVEPNHIGALSGKALVLMGVGRVAEAQRTLRAALALNPWLPERDMLLKPPDGKPAGESL